MTYGNAQRLCLGLALLSCSVLGSSSGAFAAAENTLPDTSVQTLPSNPAAPAAGSAPRQKAAVPSPVKAPEQASPAPVPVASISQDPRPTLDANTFINTMRAAWTYKRIAEAGGWPSLPAGTILKAGDKGSLVTALRQRLALEGDLPADLTTSATFDAELTNAVKRFQARHGLPESGAVRTRTLEALNVPANIRHRQLTASAQRLTTSTFPFGERYVVVNIPSAAVEAIERGEVARRYVAIVGKVDRPSPAVETRVTAVNLNPTWTVPVSLIKKDIIPHVRKDPGYLEKMKIRILDAKGQEVDPKTLDWSTQNAVNYTLRQDPGSINSLGQIRIDMPNKHAVYMHDTPEEAAFRAGCAFSFVRLRTCRRCRRLCRVAAARHQRPGRLLDKSGHRCGNLQHGTSGHPPRQTRSRRLGLSDGIRDGRRHGTFSRRCLWVRYAQDRPFIRTAGRRRARNGVDQA